jgi:hypothetical protein
MVICVKIGDFGNGFSQGYPLSRRRLSVQAMTRQLSFISDVRAYKKRI